MTGTQVLYCLALIAATSLLLATVFRRNSDGEDNKSEGPLSSYLLAGRSLGRTPVISLLMSSSFALNSLFYGAWLGYSVGLWAFVIQIFWTLSFVLLSRRIDHIRKHKSLHSFLGQYGTSTRIAGGVCSLVGMIYLIGWESSILRSTFESTVATNSPVGTASQIAGVLVFAVVATCLLYTVIGGLRGNATVDVVLNTIKSISVVGFVIALFVLLDHAPQQSVRSLLALDLETLMANLGIFGFVTNIAFNVSWQFVDASSWQSIIAGKEVNHGDMKSNVRDSGWTILIMPGLVATLFGIGAHAVAGINANNIVGQVAVASNLLLPGLIVVGTIMMICCVLSLLDGMLLTCAYTLVVDLFHPKSSLEELDANPARAEKILLVVRMALVLIAAIAVVGVNYLVPALGSNFDFVYLVIISQLSLLGPVVMALWFDRCKQRWPMSIVILASVLLGTGAVWYGTTMHIAKLVEGAGTITALFSLAAAYIFSRPSPNTLTEGTRGD
jgi:Na+/proline symporter